MDAAAILRQVTNVQLSVPLVTALTLTLYTFPKQAVVKDNEEFDFVVVGAGSSGSVVAFRLADANFKVLLMEAGGDPPVNSMTPAMFPYLPRSKMDWNYTNVPLKDKFQSHRAQTLNLTSGHVLGGGSSINYMFYTRGCPEDYANWARAANDNSWNYDGMLPYFIKSERLEDKDILKSSFRRYHGTEGFLGITRESDPKVRPYLDAFRELGNDILLDINGNRSLGYTEQMFTIAKGVRQSTAYSVLAQNKHLNMKVLKDTFVTNILFDKSNSATGVRGTVGGNKQITIRARHEVIASAGAFNTPQLLMMSGIGPAEHLKSMGIPVRKNLPVGENLQDHVPVIMSFKMDESNESPPPVNNQKFPFPTFTGYVALNRTQKYPTYQAINFLIPAGSKSPLELCTFNYGFKYDICQNLYEGGKNRNTLFVTLNLLHPKSRGRVLLRNTNPRDKPLIDVGYLENSEDMETLVDSLMDYVRVLNTTFFKSVKSEMVDLKLQMCEKLEYMSREWWRCYARSMMVTMYHYSGTCALGSVVDNKLRVSGIKKLRVIDASVMPQVVSANINGPVLAISEKGAESIIKEYESPRRTNQKGLLNLNLLF